MAHDYSRLVEEGYDRVALEYLRLEGEERWPRLEHLARLLERLPPRARVLDLGCGNGVPVARALAKRHEVVGVDISARMLDLARANVPEARFVHGNVQDVEFPEASFDAAAALYLFDHVPRGQLGETLARVRRWLKPEGWLLATFETADRPDLVGEWLGVPMFFSCFEPETTKRVVAQTGFRLVDAEIESQLEGGKEIPYLWLLAQAVLAS